MNTHRHSAWCPPSVDNNNNSSTSANLAPTLCAFLCTANGQSVHRFAFPFSAALSFMRKVNFTSANKPSGVAASAAFSYSAFLKRAAQQMSVTWSRQTWAPVFFFLTLLSTLIALPFKWLPNKNYSAGIRLVIITYHRTNTILSSRNPGNAEKEELLSSGAFTCVTSVAPVFHSIRVPPEKNGHNGINQIQPPDHRHSALTNLI